MRLNALIEEWPENILRSYGTLWIASHPDMALTLNHIGPAGFFISIEGYWVATLDPHEREAALLEHQKLELSWDSKVGDCMNELAFVSQENLDHSWSQALYHCLLTDLEMKMDWSRFPNPFPTFDDGDEEVIDGVKHIPYSHHPQTIEKVSDKRLHLRVLTGSMEP